MDGGCGKPGGQALRLIRAIGRVSWSHGLAFSSMVKEYRKGLSCRVFLHGLGSEISGAKENRGFLFIVPPLRWIFLQTGYI